MPAFFFMSRPKSAGARKVFPGATAGGGSAPTASHTQQASPSEESPVRRASPSTIMHNVPGAKPNNGALERPMSAGGAARLSHAAMAAQKLSHGESKQATNGPTAHDPNLYLRYKRPKSAAPSRSQPNVPATSPYFSRPKSAHPNNHPTTATGHSQPYPQHHLQQQAPPYPHPHHHPPHQQQGGPPAPQLGSFPYRSLTRPEPPPPPVGIAIRRIAFPTGGASGPSGVVSTSTGSAAVSSGAASGGVARRRDDAYGTEATAGITRPRSASGGRTAHAHQQHPITHHQMAWEVSGSATPGAAPLRVVGHQGMPSSSTAGGITSAKYEASGSSTNSASRPSGRGEEGASHVRNYDLMIPLNKENTTQSGSQRDSDAGSNGFPSQTTAELESRHILRQLRTRVSMLDTSATGSAAPQSLTAASEAYCSPRQRLYLQQIMLCKMLACKSTTDFYTFGQLLGQGSFAKVRVALHKLTGQQVAIKTYEKAKLKDSKHWRRVQQEIRLMEKLNNSRVIRLFETIESPKRIHIVMEYLSGSNLCSYVKAKRKLDEDEARVIFSQILESLEYIHSLNIVHRDIKLENVLFDEFQRAKLVDFGFSVVCKDKRLHVFCGTPSYMAPEIVKRREYLGKPVDLWSAGVVLYALLCGRFPFSAKTYPDLYKKIARGVFTVPEELSLAAKDLIRNLLVVDPERRYTLAQTRLHPWLAGVPRSTASEPTAPRFLISPNPQDDLDREVMARMERFGVARELLVSSILHKQRNSITTTYYLLRHAMAKQQPQQQQAGLGLKGVGLGAKAENHHLHINNKAAEAMAGRRAPVVAGKMV